MFPCRAASYPFQSLSCWRAEGHQEEMHCNFIHINSTLEYLTRAVGRIPDPASTETAPSSAPSQASGQPQHGMVYKTLRSPSLPRHKKAEPLRLRFLYGVSQAAQRVAGGCLSQSSHALASVSFLESTTAMIALPLSALPYPSTS